jgi:shikimate dehydrogenase
MMALPGRLVLIGHPVSHSLSPTFQNAALAYAGIPLTYVAVDVAPEELTRTIDELRVHRAAGNVTIPHKTAFAAACASLSPEAERTNAVNAFRIEAGSLIGHNTDVAGFDRAVRELLGRPPAGLTVGVFGAGGAASAVLAAIEGWQNCTALVANRRLDRAAQLAERFRSIAQPEDAGAIAERADLVVNATSIGMHTGERGPIDPHRLRRATAVLDLVYTPDETPFVRAARARGLRAADGLSMLVAQGAAAFSWWFDRPADVGVMWRAMGRSRPPTTG